MICAFVFECTHNKIVSHNPKGKVQMKENVPYNSSLQSNITNRVSIGSALWSFVSKDSYIRRTK